jgi:hypothetical protein
MNVTNTDSPNKGKVTITYETEGSGYVAGERGCMEHLETFLRTANVAISELRPVGNPVGLYCFDFTALRTHLNEALATWPDAEQYNLEYVRPKQSI